MIVFFNFLLLFLFFLSFLLWRVQRNKISSPSATIGAGYQGVPLYILSYYYINASQQEKKKSFACCVIWRYMAQDMVDTDYGSRTAC